MLMLTWTQIKAMIMQIVHIINVGVTWLLAKLGRILPIVFVRVI